ncbi:MAG: FAD-binding protein [Eubacteriales bacterium]|nr:FAD-binding protein [Eubacteriales bacterium]
MNKISSDIVATDALIIGGGLSGLIAAKFLLKEAGHTAPEIMILRNGAGASPFVHGFSAVLHRDDTKEAFVDDTLKSGAYINDRKLVEKLCNESTGIVKLLEAEGITFKKSEDGSYDLLRPLGASYPRVVCTENSAGPAIISFVRRELKASGLCNFSNTMRALRLYTKKGEVKGALVYDTEKSDFRFISAKLVILATGGFCRIFPSSTNTSDISGDGIAMAYEAGAELADMEFIQFEPAVSVYPEVLKGKGMITTMFYEGAVLRNSAGERFMTRYGPDAERVNKDVLSACMYSEIDSGRGTKHGGVYFDATGVGREKLLKSYSIYVRRYEEAGMDISKEYIEVAPAPHTSLGGVVIQPDCSTNLKGFFACGEITGGIHGANRIGGNAGLETLVFGRSAGLSAGRYLLSMAPGSLGTGGDSMPENDRAEKQEISAWISAITGISGHCEAEQISGEPDNIHFDFAKDAEDVDVAEDADTRGKAIDYPYRDKEAQYRKNMEDLLAGGFNVIREGNVMENALVELENMLAGLLKESGEVPPSCPAEAYSRIRLNNDITAAILLAHSALARTDSAGCHIRKDSKKRSIDKKENSEFSVRIIKGDAGPAIRHWKG